MPICRSRSATRAVIFSKPSSPNSSCSFLSNSSAIASYSFDETRPCSMGKSSVSSRGMRTIHPDEGLHGGDQPLPVVDVLAAAGNEREDGLCHASSGIVLLAGHRRDRCRTSDRHAEGVVGEQPVVALAHLFRLP